MALNNSRFNNRLCRSILSIAVVSSWVGGLESHVRADELSPADWQRILNLQQQRVTAINSVVGSVIAIYDEHRVGGGSGVIIDPSGIALTNHHVIMGAGIQGWGGLADGKLYSWKLIGTDPGGDVAVIQMEGRDDFPFTPLGDSDTVRVGDWALAMGNPFILTEDQAPTVTLGIVSGVKRYQPGAGTNELVYGNCIQVDSSINPGNSGGPLFNFSSRVIGINGRGSFQDRGRVNVGLGYAISANQIKNFLPDLLATKLVEHGTLDASFSDRDGKVVCSTINQEAPAAKAGLKLGDQLLEFEGQSISNANQFTNLICTLPQDWPAMLKIRRPNSDEMTIHVRLLGLPYQQPPRPKTPPSPKPGEQPPPSEEQQQQKRQQEMVDLLSANPGEIRFPGINQKYAQAIVADWRRQAIGKSVDSPAVLKLTDDIRRDGQSIGSQELLLATDGRFRIQWQTDLEQKIYLFDGNKFMVGGVGQDLAELSLVEAKLSLPIVQAISIAAASHAQPFAVFGSPILDGGDKSLQQNAYRMRLMDQENDQFFLWLSMYDELGLPKIRLLKASAEKDCDGQGGVTFAQWQRSDSLTIPLQRTFVSGIAETPQLTLVNQDHSWIAEPDLSIFEVPTSTAKQ